MATVGVEGLMPLCTMSSC